MQEAYIVDAIRTPIGKFCGTLSSVRPDDMAALTIRTLLERNAKVDPTRIDDVILGCANQAGEDNRNVARMASLLAGVPDNVPGETVNRLCASGLSAVVSAGRSIKCGEGNLFLAGGVESMTRAPYVLSKSPTPYARTAELFDTSIGWRFVNPKMEELYGTDSMGETAENVAQKFSISREDQDKFAYNSQMKCAEALKRGRFEGEIVEVVIPQRRKDSIHFNTDEFPRPTSTLEALTKLRAAFATDGSVTAGNASGINDGACAVLVASEQAVKEFGLTPRAKILSAAAVGVEPRIMGVGPVAAVQKVLQMSGLNLDQIDIIELNEAFAAQSLACLRELGIADDDPRVNPNGGAIAIGHPLGMSGARLVQTAMIELEERKASRAICSMCVGVGQGMACLIERVS